MTRRVVPVVIALLAISALGIAASTLETTLTTDPDDEINPDWDRLPIGQGDAATLQDEIEGETDDAEPDSGETDEQREMSSQRDDQETSGFGEAAGSSLGEWTLLDRLVALLWTIVPLLAVVAGAALLYRYRSKLASMFDSEPPPSFEVLEVEWPAVDPSNAVDRAWLAVMRRVDPERPETTTVGECRALARERGLNEAAVEAIATAFERVHYGGVPVSEEVDRARDGLRRLEGDER